eukprot:1156980-Pelagomonas_calceolata.AAC.3
MHAPALQQTRNERARTALSAQLQRVEQAMRAEQDRRRHEKIESEWKRGKQKKNEALAVVAITMLEAPMALCRVSSCITLQAKERGALEGGVKTKPFYLKKGEKKKMALMARFQVIAQRAWSVCNCVGRMSSACVVFLFLHLPTRAAHLKQ